MIGCVLQILYTFRLDRKPVCSSLVYEQKFRARFRGRALLPTVIQQGPFRGRAARAVSKTVDMVGIAWLVTGRPSGDV